MYNTLIYGYLLAAKRHPERSTIAYTEALYAAEEGIAYLNREDRFISSRKTATDASLPKVDLAKATLSLKAAKICSKLGNEQAARAYVNDANIHSPNADPAVMSRVVKLDLKTWPDEPLVTTKPVLWKG